MTEFLPGFEASFWGGVGVPKSTPTEIVDRLNNEINAALTDSEVMTRLADPGATAVPGLPADFGKLLAHETDKSAPRSVFSWCD